MYKQVFLYNDFMIKSPFEGTLLPNVKTSHYFRGQFIQKLVSLALDEH